MRRTVLALVAFAALAPAATASAAPPVPSDPADHALECFIQWVTVAEPAVRPVQIGPDGSIHVYPAVVTDKAERDAARAVRFAECLATG